MLLRSPYAICGTEIGSMSGTEIGYGGTRRPRGDCTVESSLCSKRYWHGLCATRPLRECAVY
eukprot:1855279-Rhodomonas_salina.3